MNPSSTSENVAVGALEVEHKEVDDATFFDEMDEGLLALSEDSAGDEDVEFDHGSELSDTRSVDLLQEYGDQGAGMSDEQDVDYEPIQDVSKRRSKRPLKNLFYSDDEDDDADVYEEGAPAVQPAKKKRKKMPFCFDDEDDDEDDDEEGEPAEQPAKKKTKKMLVSSAEAVAEKDPKRRKPADEPARKKKPTRCPVCGVLRTQLARHIMAKHKDWSKVKAQNVRWAKNETKRKRVQCPMCSTRVVKLKYHLHQMHNVEPGSMQELHLLAPTSKMAANKLNQEMNKQVPQTGPKVPKDLLHPVAEKDPKRRKPADEPARKKKPTRCPVCGVLRTQLARHIMAKHKDWSKVKAQNVRWAKNETKRKRVQCPMCSTRVVKLKYHLHQMHNVEPGSMQELHLLAPTSKMAANKLNQEMNKQVPQTGPKVPKDLLHPVIMPKHCKPLTLSVLCVFSRHHAKAL
ncbi:hypothetical protein ACOMHN_049091 [Nucella lapillus]